LKLVPPLTPFFVVPQSRPSPFSSPSDPLLHCRSHQQAAKVGGRVAHRIRSFRLSRVFCLLPRVWNEKKRQAAKHSLHLPSPRLLISVSSPCPLGCCPTGIFGKDGPKGENRYYQRSTLLAPARSPPLLPPSLTPPLLSQGPAESIRLALTIGKVPFTDDRLSFDVWKTQKAGTRWGQLPYLTVGDEVLSQSGAIAGYAAEVAGLTPKDAW